jgi:GMP synthase (glutamine-hydrolysing)
MPDIAVIKLGSTFPDIAERLGDFEDWFVDGLSPEAASITVVDADAGERLPDPDAISGAVLTGSHAMVTDAPAWNTPVTRWIHRMVDARVPLLGVCYGHQLLAKAFGGTIGDHPHGREFGTVEIRLTADAERDALLGGLPARFPAHACHRQSVLTLPPEAVRLAGNAHDPHHAFVLADTAWGVQFHPEFNESAIRAYIRASAEDLRLEGQDPDRLLQSTAAAPEAAGLLKRFAAMAGSIAP